MKDVAARRLPGTYKVQVALEPRYGDMDENGHLNNVAIARLFEEVRVQQNRQAGAHLQWATGRPRYLAAHVAIDYLAEGQYPGTVTIGYGIVSVGRSSFRAGMAAFQAGQCIALCDSVLVFRGPDGPAPIPADLRSLLEGMALNL